MCLNEYIVNKAERKLGNYVVSEIVNNINLSDKDLDDTTSERLEYFLNNTINPLEYSNFINKTYNQHLKGANSNTLEYIYIYIYMDNVEKYTMKFLEKIWK